MAAIREQLGRGASFAAPHPLTKRLAEMLCERVASLERVRFTNSGTEAVMMAARAARAYTGRPLIAKAEGGYHGTWDDIQVGVAPARDRAGDAERELTRELGALLLLDEIITLRLSTGGAQELYGLAPDLTTIGKMIGGGLPVGAFGGRASVMEAFDPSRPGAIQHYGTFNGNPATMAGGIAVLELLSPEEYERLNALGDRLRDGIDALADELGLAVCATGTGSLVNIHLTASPPRCYRDHAFAVDQEQVSLFHLACLNEGLFLARRGLMSTSTPMDDSTIDEVLVRLHRALESVHAERPLTATARAL